MLGGRVRGLATEHAMAEAVRGRVQDGFPGAAGSAPGPGMLRPRGTLGWRSPVASGPKDEAVRHHEDGHGRQHEERTDPEECAVMRARPEGPAGRAAVRVRAAVVFLDALEVVQGCRVPKWEAAWRDTRKGWESHTVSNP